MKTHIKHLLLSLLLAFLIIGLAACAPAGQSSEGGLQAPPASSGDSPAAVGEPSESPGGTEEEAWPVFDCTETNPHPMGQSIAETYEDVSYEQVMTWFCDGYTFDDILIALETSEATDVPASVLLEMLWDKPWEEI